MYREVGRVEEFKTFYVLHKTLKGRNVKYDTGIRVTRQCQLGNWLLCCHKLLGETRSYALQDKKRVENPIPIILRYIKKGNAVNL